MRKTPPHRSLRPRPAGRLAAALAVSLLAAPAAQATTKRNVSHLVMGTNQTINWTAEAAAPAINCTSCTWRASTSVRIDPSESGLPIGTTTLGPTWPGAQSSNMPKPPLKEQEVLTPQGTLDASGNELVFSNDYYRRAAVDFGTFSDKRAIAGTYSTGSATTTMAYHVKVTNTSGETRGLFIDLEEPRPQRSMMWAQYLHPFNSGTWFKITHESAFSRNAADIYVDGISVWGNESNYLFPENWGHSASEYIDVKWGDTVHEDQLKLFLGWIPAGQTLYIDMVFRVDVFADAPDCGHWTVNQINGTEKHTQCFLLGESRLMGAKAAPSPPGTWPESTIDLSIYWKDML